MNEKDEFFGKLWKIVSKSSGKVMEAADPNDPQYGVNIRQNDWNGGSNQKFLLIPTKPPAKEGDRALNYYIIAYYSGAAIAAQHCWDNLDIGINVWQFDFNGTDGQQWQLKSIEEHSYIFLSKCFNRNMCIGVSYDTWLPRDNYKTLLGLQIAEAINIIDIWTIDRPKKLLDYISKFGTNKALFKPYLPHKSGHDASYYLALLPKEFKLIKGNNVDVQTYSANDNNQIWKIEQVGEINLPELKKSPVDYGDKGMGNSLPKINNLNELPPGSTKPVLIYEEYLPFIYVNDDQLNTQRQSLESPYYILSLEQLWVYSNQSAEVVPGRETTFRLKRRIGMTQEHKTSMEKVLTKKISTDVKIGYKDVINLGVSGEISSETKTVWESSTKFELEKEEEIEIKYSSPKRVNMFQYQLIDRYTLYRMNRSKVESFDVQTPFTKMVTYPKDHGMLASIS